MVVIHYKKFAFYWLKFFAVIFFILGYFYLTYLSNPAVKLRPLGRRYKAG